MNRIDVYEHGVKLIDEQFTLTHWKACVTFNELHGNEYFDILHNGLRFKHFVGALQIDHLLIQIHPKADKNDSDEKWQGVLIQMLKACGRLKAQTFDNANLKKQPFNLLELYFEYYLNEVEKLIQQGLVKHYRKHTGNVKALKGKMDFSGNIRQNLVHQERFYTTHQVYDRDYLLHQVLRYTLDIVHHFSRGTRLSDKSGRIRLAFPEIKEIHPTVTLLEKICLDRKTAPYDRALELAKLIILNYSPDIQKGQNKMISLLFDMNQLWEEYVYAQLRKHFADNPEWEISGQESKTFHGSWRTLRPDIVLRNGNNTFIIDTKWKIPKNKSASIEDLRQMYVYGRFWTSEKMVLLYPGNHDSGNYLPYQNKNTDGYDHQCKIAFANVLDNKRLCKSFAENIIMLLDQV